MATKTALISGANKGIGKEAARQLAAKVREVTQLFLPIMCQCRVNLMSRQQFTIAL